jgi:hypothetical protein
MRYRTTSLAISLLGLALLGACDKSTSPDDGLTPAEARAIALAVDNGGTAAVDGEASGASFALIPSGSPSSDRVTVTKDFDVTVPCPRGGNAAVRGDGALVMDDVAKEILLDLSGTSTQAGCAFRTDKGLDVELTGGLDFVAHRELREGEASGTQSHEGSVDYVLGDGRSGTCAVDLEASFSLTASNATRNVVGTVCGQEVSANTTWTFTRS